MKKFKKISALAGLLLAVMVGLSYGQVVDGNDGVGATYPQNLNKTVDVYTGAEKLTVSFNGVAQTRLITGGRGVLVGVEVNSCSSGGTTVTALPVAVYDVASVSGVTLASTSLGNTSKVVADQWVGPLAGLQPVSLGGAYSSATLANTRLNSYRQHPVKFENGMVIDHSTISHGSITFYWLK